MRSNVTKYCKLRRLSLGAAVALTGITAHAADGDPFQIFATDTYTYYSNVFLIPGDTPPTSAGIPDPTRSDKSNEADAGFTFKNIYGQQDFDVHAKFSKIDFEHFKQLDYAGHDLLFNWNWKISNFLEGKLGITDVKELMPYTDFHLQQRNLMDTQHAFYNGDIKFTPEWRLHTGLEQVKETFALPSEQILDNTTRTEVIGVDYVTYNGSATGLQFQHESGVYPYYVEFDGKPESNNFTQDALNVNIDWHPSSITTLTALAGYAKRTSQVTTDLSIYGMNGKADLIWSLTDKLKVDFGVLREFVPIQTGEIGYVIDNGGKVAVIWDATGKIQLNASAQYDKRKFFQFVNGLLTPYYDDATNNVALSAKYSPRKFFDITVAATHSLRSSDLPEIGFLGNSGSISANLKF